MNYNLYDNSINDIARYVQKSPSLILPLAPIEPLGNDCPLHTIPFINKRIAYSVAERVAILCAPVMQYGYSTPFKAFEGVLSTRKETFVKTIADTVRSAVGWGIETVYFLEGSSYLADSIHEAIKRYRKKLPQNFQYTVISWQSLAIVRKFIKARFENLDEVFRCEAVYAYLATELYGNTIKTPMTKLPDRELVQKWRKRGMDPEKLRAYAHDGFLSRWTSYSCDELLIPIIVDEIVSVIKKGE